MSEHFTLNTKEVSKYCPTCNRKTMHSVSGKRLGPCMKHTPNLLTKEQERLRKRQEAWRLNMNLFE